MSAQRRRAVRQHLCYLHFVKRSTIQLDPDLEMLLKLEALRRKQPMDELLREALRSYLSDVPRKLPPGTGAFDSGHADTGERNEEVLGELGFGRDRT
jgi:hypothetical protein